MHVPVFCSVHDMLKCPLGGMGLFLLKSVKLYGTSSRVQFVFNAESLHAVGVPIMDVVCATGVPTVAEGTGSGCQQPARLEMA